MIPCVWSFMKRRRTKDYIRLLKALIFEANKHGLILKPGQIMIDFELAAKLAFEKIFIGIIVKGCLFHFGQSLFRKFVALGLKTYYIDIKEVQEWFKSIFCLALIPINNVEQQFELLSNQMTLVVCRNFSERSKGKDFLKYFTNTYKSPNCQFPIQMWNHFDNHDERTNNRVEDDNIIL